MSNCNIDQSNALGLLPGKISFLFSELSYDKKRPEMARLLSALTRGIFMGNYGENTPWDSLDF